MSVHSRHMLVGKCVFVLIVAVGVVGCSVGGPDLSELQPGDCISGQPYLYPPDIELIDCSEANPVTDTMVVFVESATGDSYPGNLEEMSARCAGEGGFFLEPSRETWDDGDRIGLCSTSVEMGKYRDFGQSSDSNTPSDQGSASSTQDSSPQPSSEDLDNADDKLGNLILLSSSYPDVGFAYTLSFVNTETGQSDSRHFTLPEGGEVNPRGGRRLPFNTDLTKLAVVNNQRDSSSYYLSAGYVEANGNYVEVATAESSFEGEGGFYAATFQDDQLLVLTRNNEWLNPISREAQASGPEGYADSNNSDLYVSGSELVDYGLGECSSNSVPSRITRGCYQAAFDDGDIEFTDGQTSETIETRGGDCTSLLAVDSRDNFYCVDELYNEQKQLVRVERSTGEVFGLTPKTDQAILQAIVSSNDEQVLFTGRREGDPTMAYVVAAAGGTEPRELSSALVDQLSEDQELYRWTAKSRSESAASGAEPDPESTVATTAPAGDGVCESLPGEAQSPNCPPGDSQAEVSQVSFEHEIYEVEDDPGAIAAADLDGDGDTDLTTANRFSYDSGNDLSVLINNGDGTFVKGETYEVGDEPVSVTATDLDGDGDTDLAIANFGSIGESGAVSVLINNGDATFDKGETYEVGSRPQSVTAADLDGDGNMDLATANYGSDDVSVLTNDGDGDFSPAGAYEVESSPEAITTTDLDGDGDTDLAVANGGYDTVSVLTNDGDGTFTSDMSYEVGSSPRSITAADLDGDGDADLATADLSDSTASVLINNGDATFAPYKSYGVGEEPMSITTSDLNGDGYIDLAIVNNNSNNVSDDVSVLINKGDTTFAKSKNYEMENYPESIASSDLNGDGNMDLVTADGSSNTVSVLISLSVESD